jgi:Ser/Thr protein kinase RdoA (MazF antagonist)
LGKSTTKAQCTTLLNKAITLAQQAIQRHATANPKILHADNIPANVFFDAGLTQAEFVDWGSSGATQVPSMFHFIIYS